MDSIGTELKTTRPTWIPVGTDFRLHQFAFKFDFMLENDDVLIMVDKELGYVTHFKKVASKKILLAKTFLAGLVLGMGIFAIGMKHSVSK